MSATKDESGTPFHWRELAPLAVILVLYAIATALLLPRVRWQLNPDGVSYIVIARRVLAGEWRGAISSHWSPLFSIALLPFLARGVDALVACKLVTFIAGAVVLTGLWMLAPRFTRTMSMRIAVTATFAPYVLAWASSLVTPDLMLVAILLFYFVAVANDRTSSALVAGLLGGLAFLAKSYGLPFFVVHFAFVQLARWWRADRTNGRRRAIQFVLGLLGFLIVSLPWIALISAKYGHFTTGSAAAYNWRLNGPLVRGHHPMQTRGLLPPSDPEALSVWDDPSVITFPAWPHQASSVVYLLGLVGHNLLHLLGILASISVLALPLIAYALYLVIIGRTDARHRWLIVVTLLTCGIFSAGFLPLLIEERYVWIVHALLLLLAAAVVEEAGERAQLRPRSRRLLMAAVLLTFALRPLVVTHVQDQARDARDEAEAIIGSGVNLHGKRLAANQNWESTLYLNYMLGGHYFGTPAPRESDAAIQRELDRNRIDAFIVWNAPRPSYLQGFHVVDAEEDFVVYER